jgi:ribonuclease P protein component
VRVDTSHDVRFRRSQRLRLPDQFQRCFAQGARANGRCFRLHWLPADASRLGLAVSRKVDTSAVVRNRIKRVTRDFFRHHPPAPSGDCVLVALRPAATASAAELRDDLQRLWQRLPTLQPPTPKPPALKPHEAAGTMRDAPAPPAARGD